MKSPTARSRRTLAAWSLAAILGACGLVAGAAHAEPTSQTPPASSAVTELAQQGADAYVNGRYEEAAAKLREAYPELRVPTVGLFLARSLEKLGLLVEASAIYGEVQHLSTTVGQQAVQEQARLSAAQEQAALALRIPQVRLLLEDAAVEQVEVSIDGVAVPRSELGRPRLLNPGRHSIEAACDGRPAPTQTLELGEGEIRQVTLQLECPTRSVAPPPEAVVAPAQRPGAPRATYDLWHPVPLTAFGVGAVGVLVGGITGVLAMSKQDDLDERGCVDQHCPITFEDDVRTLNSLRNVSTASFVIGGAGVAVGAALVLVPLRNPNRTGVTACAGPTMVGVRGAF